MHPSTHFALPARAARTARRPVLLTVLALVAALLLPLFVGTGTASASTATERSIAASVTSLLNSERRAHHLRSLTTNVHLVSSARSHNLAMARRNTMSHQVSGESALGRRIDRTGYRWTWAGENIGWNSRMTKAGVLALQTAMYNEHAPENGHRLNILSTHYRNVGVDVYLDRAHHKAWLTTDFGKL